MKIPVFTGASAALVTPMRDGRVDTDTLISLLTMQKNAGSEAVTLCGTTGEGATLTDAEFCDILTRSRRFLGDGMKIVAGCSGNDTTRILEKCVMAELCGADAVLITTPYYNKTTQDGLCRHFETIAKECDLPIILYNVPSRTGMSFTAETYKQLSEIENINGVKEASGDFDLIGRTVSLCGNDLNIWSGNDSQTVPVMALGGCGVISVAANLMPKTMMELCDACDDNDYETARRLLRKYYRLWDALFTVVNPIPIKTMLAYLGFCADEMRLPLVNVDEITRGKILSVFEAYSDCLR